MVNRSWGNFWGNQNQSMANAQFLPDQVAPTQYASPRVMPTEQYVQRNITNQVVPHVHPTHLTTIHQQNVHHQHHFPHTCSHVHECHETHTMCGERWNPWHHCNR